MKKVLSWIAASAGMMLALPWMAVTFVKGDGGMAICFLLFFALNPIYAICVGAAAGRDGRKLWALPVITALLFLIGTWLFFDWREKAFVLYALIYLFLGIAAMLISMFIKKKKKYDAFRFDRDVHPDRKSRLRSGRRLFYRGKLQIRGRKKHIR